MKLVFSRKGFDSQYGGVPSPIFPDGSLCSLPIPSREDTRLCDLEFRGENLGSIVSDLTKRRIGPMRGIHLDPDLRRDAVPRQPGWLPMFGQADAAATHLENQGVGAGDIFLFFGWFRQTTRLDGRLVYDGRSPHLHVIFGWLQVGRVLSPSRENAVIPAWAATHPHVANAHRRGEKNTLYVATRRLRLDGLAELRAGGGVFQRLAPVLRLTAPGHNRGVWRLPPWFFPGDGRPPPSYHKDPRRWRVERAGVLLQTVGRGQEFVLDCDWYPEVRGWLLDIFATADDKASKA